MPISSAADTEPATYLRQEYETQQALFCSQTNIVQRFLGIQARQLADVLLRSPRPSQARFTLPDRVIPEPGGQPVALPADMREQMIGGLLERLIRPDLIVALRQRLAELEQSSNPAVCAAGGLFRYTLAKVMVHDMLPAGRSVTYVAAEGEEIPTIPQPQPDEVGSAITTAADAIAVEEGPAETGRGELHVPYVPYARRFYLPQWVAFDEQGKLLVNSLAEAEAHIASMQRFVAVLHTAVGLAGYFVADEEYRKKRYGMLGQLINQGRALARYQTGEIIRIIKQRAAAQDLNRGLSISLPYFDDQDLQSKTYPFEVIPAGRIMFVPAFVVRAVREEAAKVAQDTRLSPSTRKHILGELALLEQAFI